MSEGPVVKTLIAFLHDARRGKLKRGSLFLASDAIVGDVQAMLLPDFADPQVATNAGFTREISSDTIEQCVEWARNYHDPPDANDMLETCTYYLANDAFPPLPGETFSNVSPDRAFYESLGPETGAVCRHDGCTRASIAHSVRCRVHHFEAMMERACPFDD